MKIKLWDFMGFNGQYLDKVAVFIGPGLRPRKGLRIGGK